MTLIRAAQYLRMSTEHQQYSLENQSATIRQYAERNGFVLVQSYSDPAKSGLTLKNRPGLKQLLSDVVAGTNAFRAVLVYDISRWGRFQDTDEAAHYEYLCRSAGTEVHYCAEAFPNDCSIPSLLMKALKRTMAGEYSRELSAKVVAGHKRMAALGLKQGGNPGYGYRRLLVSASGEPKIQLLSGQRKNIQEDRVRLILGPKDEVNCVRDMYRMYTEERKLPVQIARELNQRGILYPGAKRRAWYPLAVVRILTNPKYMGCNVYGRTSQRLGMKKSRLEKSMWTIAQNSWAPIVDAPTFAKAQQRFASQTFFKTNEELLADLRILLRDKGRLSERLVREAPDLPSQGTYARRFGSESQAFFLAGYEKARIGSTEKLRKRRTLRDQLVQALIRHSQAKVTIVQPDGHWRVRLRVSGRLLVSLYIVPSGKTENGETRWTLNVVPKEADRVSLIARLTPNNDDVQDYFVQADLHGRTRWTMTLNDPGLKQGKQLLDFGEFARVVEEVRRSRHQARR